MTKINELLKTYTSQIFPIQDTIAKEQAFTKLSKERLFKDVASINFKPPSYTRKEVTSHSSKVWEIAKDRSLSAKELINILNSNG